MNKIATIIRESGTARFLIPAGIMLVVFGIIFFSASKRNKDYIQTESSVAAIELEEAEHTDGKGNRTEATYTLTVKYVVNGREYEAELPGMSKYEPGEKIRIYYNPLDPGQITQTKSLIIPLGIIAAGIAAIVGGIISGVNAIRKYKSMKAQEREWTHG